MNEDNDDVALLSALGWQMIETVEHMLKEGFTIDEVCVAWDCQPGHIAYMLARAQAERMMLEQDLLGGGRE